MPVATPLDLGELVRRVVAELAPQAIRQRQTIELDAAAPCPVQGDATLLAVLVRNLVDNAIRYSPEQSRVQVSVSRHGEVVRLKVEDSGPGMQAPDLSRLGERFFRVLGSAQGGSGLGWSIVRRIAAVHHAAVQVGRSAALGGLLVEVDWPALKDS